MGAVSATWRHKGGTFLMRWVFGYRLDLFVSFLLESWDSLLPCRLEQMKGGSRIIGKLRPSLAGVGVDTRRIKHFGWFCWSCFSFFFFWKLLIMFIHRLQSPKSQELERFCYQSLQEFGLGCYNGEGYQYCLWMGVTGMNECSSMTFQYTTWWFWHPKAASMKYAQLTSLHAEDLWISSRHWFQQS